MDFIIRLLEDSSIPWISAFLLGIMTAISPCPLATNITAIGYISKDIENKNKVFINGIIYTAGRAITYFIIAAIIYIGIDQVNLSFIFQKYGEKFLGPLLITIGILMLDVLKIRLPQIFQINNKFQKRNSWNFLDVLFLGIIFALAFCPYSAVLYFGMLIPMTITSVWGLYLPIIFAFATGIPVIFFSFILAYTVNSIANAYNKLKIFGLWFRRFAAVLFIIIGIFYIIRIYF